jgi:7,8-dihydroneopterin aldolase/epimerase/oxygenase
VTDRIELRGLRFAGICGVLPEERERRQPLEVDLDIVAELAEAGRTDQLAATVDYGQICAEVEQVIATQQPQLLERLAQLIADAVLDDDRVVEVTVVVRKLRPPVPQQLATSGVRVTRSRG